MLDRWCGRLVPLFLFHTFYTCLSGLLWLRCSDLLHTVDISIYPYQRRKNPARNQNKNRFLQFCRLDTCHWDMHRKSLPMQKQHTFLFRSCNEMKMKIKRKNVRKNEYRTKQKCAKWNVSYALCRIYIQPQLLCYNSQRTFGTQCAPHCLHCGNVQLDTFYKRHQ